MLTLSQLVAHARHHSPYYARRLAALPEQGWQLHDLPLTDPADYWQDSESLDGWPVLSGAVDDAHVFKTGGSTGQGKLAVYRRSEWRHFVTAFGEAMAAQLQAGDRVANLFFAGDLYTSFLFIHGALAHAPLPVLEFPFTGAVESATLAEAIHRYRINVLACVPAQLLRFADHLDRHGLTLPEVNTVLYGGESLFAAQLPQLKRVLPKARFASIGYASVDAGLLGASAPDCTLGEHRVFDGDTLVEIVDEHSGEPIEECGRTGVLVVTNLTRTLMPLLRYPVGDLAAWTEVAGTPRRKFVLCGRASQSHRIRVGTLSLFPDEIGQRVRELAGERPWQLWIERSGSADRLTLRWEADGCTTAEALTQSLSAALLTHYPELQALRTSGELIWSVEACSAAKLALHPRSGKLLRVVDRRDYQMAAQEVVA
ncbi:phenylacetate--CoA ligase family protein [Chitinimonas lacunae]|uniref:Phenylacetate--CoA ligase family protein n=1 Tax=Chitinimonas lacunae TaxID=1963018 RepID=A0ABV8MJX0_9NEIS